MKNYDLELDEFLETYNNIEMKTMVEYHDGYCPTIQEYDGELELYMIAKENYIMEYETYVKDIQEKINELNDKLIDEYCKHNYK